MLKVGDLVWWDGFFHNKIGVINSLDPGPPLHPEDYALPGIIVKCINENHCEVMVGNKLILSDFAMLIPMFRENEVI